LARSGKGPYWNSEIIDAYCKILILAKQIGRVNYFTPGQTKELLDLKKKLGYDDDRFHRGENCDLCGNNSFGRGYTEEEAEEKLASVQRPARSSAQNGHAHTANDMETLVRVVTDQVMAALVVGRARDRRSHLLRKERRKPLALKIDSAEDLKLCFSHQPGHYQHR